jgi:hypothetical protein
MTEGEWQATIFVIPAQVWIQSGMHYTRMLSAKACAGMTGT